MVRELLGSIGGDGLGSLVKEFLVGWEVLGWEMKVNIVVSFIGIHLLAVFTPLLISESDPLVIAVPSYLAGIYAGIAVMGVTEIGSSKLLIPKVVRDFWVKIVEKNFELEPLTDKGEEMMIKLGETEKGEKDSNGPGED